VAVDNDPQAIIATINNIKANRCQNKINVLLTDDENDLEQVDLLIANILANPLIGLCEHFANLVRSGGKIALSGILQNQLNSVLDAYGKYFADLKITQKDDWCCVDGKRK
jgi:ribosomal protein L11 methyltransferase